MANTENVVKAINICLGHGVCNDCPYCFSGKGYTTLNCRDYMLRDVLALLEKQEAVEPTIDEYGNKRCGSCGHKLQSIADPDLFCCKCGKPVLWEGR